MGALASLFGYILNFLYNICNNYGIAIIIFSVLLRLILLPLTIKQQKTMQKSTKLNAKMQELQFKYKNDPERLNQETLRMYKEENLSPFSGCFSMILQLVIIVSVFYMVSSPLTYMKKLDPQIINEYRTKLNEDNAGVSSYHEIAIIQRYSDMDDRLKINMNFLGIDLSQVPKDNFTDFRVYIIPLLYVVSSFISIKITTKNQMNTQNKLIESSDQKDAGGSNELQSVQQMSKSMNYMMPILSLSIAIIAPLGLALYWLISNILMTVEKVMIDIILKKEEEM